MKQALRKSVYVLQHAPQETLGELRHFLPKAGVAWCTVPLFRNPLQELPWESLAALVVLGGPMNVDQVDVYPFLKLELPWIHEAIRRDLPVLGICLGAQLLAKALGARVYPHVVKEIGWYSVQLTAPRTDRLFDGLSGPHTVFQWHGDTFELPSGGVQLARSEQCEQQAFRYGEKAYGLQFHIEVTADMVHQWLEVPANRAELLELDYIDPQEIRDRLPAAMREMKLLGRQVLSQFASLCRDHA